MRIKVILAALYVPLLGTMLLLPLAARNRLEHALFDGVHAPLFAVLAIAIFVLLRLVVENRPILCAFTGFLLASGMGAILEVAQSYVGRSSSVPDAIANILGAAAGALWTLTTAYGPWPRRAFAVAGTFCLLVAEIPPASMLADVLVQRRQLPRVASFESFLEMSRWHPRECGWTRVEEHATEGRFALRVELAREGKYPGPIMIDPGANWTGHDYFRCDLWLDGEEPLPLIVKIEDAAHNGDFHDRFHQSFVLLPGPNYLKISLAEVAAAPRDRQLDLSTVKMVQFFTRRPASARTIYLDNLRLE
ncbi:MAG: VanZ family protein [Planctomycetales bacterium]|nr:VanZ family protein [Planctomycetales bacterium]